MAQIKHISILDQIAEKAARANVQQTLESARWFRLKMREVRQVPPHRILKEQQRKGLLKAVDTRGRYRFLGRMFSFFYDPQTKDKLTFYDRFPLVIPIRESGNRFWGLNLHYLSPRMRVFFLAKLSAYLVNPRGKSNDISENILNPYDESTRLRFTSWHVFDKTKLARFARPTIKQYIRGNIKSRLIEFAPSEWVMAAFLPTARFIGARREEVWDDSATIGAAAMKGLY